MDISDNIIWEHILLIKIWPLIYLFLYKVNIEFPLIDIVSVNILLLTFATASPTRTPFIKLTICLLSSIKYIFRVLLRTK